MYPGGLYERGEFANIITQGSDPLQRLEVKQTSSVANIISIINDMYISFAKTF